MSRQIIPRHKSGAEDSTLALGEKPLWSQNNHFNEQLSVTTHAVYGFSTYSSKQQARVWGNKH